MKIGIYSPYLDSLAGGERYVLTLAGYWSAAHSVSIFWDDDTIKKQAENRFNLILKNVEVVPNIFAQKNLMKKLFVTAGYDCIFFLSDGSVPMSLARRNILHFQVPFSHVLMSFWKKQRFQRIVCNSQFTEDNLDLKLTTARTVIYPPVTSGEASEVLEKSKTILTVGRFSSLYGAKKQNILIDAFINLCKKGNISGWKLIVAGGLLSADKKYFEQLENQAKGFPVEFYPNCDYPKLQSLYKQASIYWHAAGFRESKPEYMEHFGITTVEAMAAGCVPVVFNGGGQPEIVDEGKTGYVWNTIDELLNKTVLVIQKSSALVDMRANIQKKADEFSIKRFTQAFDVLLQEL